MNRDERSQLNKHIHAQGVLSSDYLAYSATLCWAIDTGRLSLDDVLAMDHDALVAEYERLNGCLSSVA